MSSTSAAIEQAGQRVVIGHVLQLRLIANALADVLYLAEEMLRRAVGGTHERRMDGDPHDLTDDVHEALLHPERALLAGQQDAHHLLVAVCVRWMAEVGEAHLLQLLARVAGECAERVVDLDEGSVEVGQRHADRRRLERGAEALLCSGDALDALAQRGIGRDALADVAHDRLPFDRLAGVRVEHPPDARLDPHVTALAVSQPSVDGDRAALVIDATPRSEDLMAIVGMNELARLAPEQLLRLVADQLAAGGGRVGDAPGRTEDDDGVRGVVGEQAVALLGGAQLLNRGALAANGLEHATRCASAPRAPGEAGPGSQHHAVTIGSAPPLL
jgi:hypothetical protein